MASAHKIEAHANAHGKGSAYSLQPGSVRTWVDANQIVDEIFAICINVIKCLAHICLCFVDSIDVFVFVLNLKFNSLYYISKIEKNTQKKKAKETVTTHQSLVQKHKRL